MELLKFLFPVLWGLGYLGNGILFISIEWSFLQQSFVQIFNPLLHFQVFGVLLTAHLFWVFLTMAVVGSYAVSIIERHLAQAAEQAEFHAAKAVYESPQRFQERKPSSPLPSVRSKQNSYSPPQAFPKPASKVETESVEPQVKLLEWAIQSSQKVQFSYETRNGEKSDKPSAWLRDRTLTPISFKTVGQTLCLQGYCYLRSAKRNFAIIRMRDIKIISANQANYQKVISDEVITPPDVQVIVSPASQIPLPELTQKKKYEQVTSKELTTPPDVQIEASPISQSPLPEVTKTKNTETQVKQRPYLKYRTNELETIAASKWDNTEVLNKIHYELEFRSRTKALGLRQRITTRLTEIFESL